MASMADPNNPFDYACKEIALKQEVVNVTATWWAVGRTEEEIEKEAYQRLNVNHGIEYPAKEHHKKI